MLYSDSLFWRQLLAHTDQALDSLSLEHPSPPNSVIDLNSGPHYTSSLSFRKAVCLSFLIVSSSPLESFPRRTSQTTPKRKVIHPRIIFVEMPDQKTLEDRRKAKIVLKELRQHHQEVEDDKQDATDCRSDALKGHFEKAKDNIEKSTTVDQALVDAQIFRKLAEYTGKQAEQLQSGLRTCDVKTFMDCLSKSIRGEDEIEPDEGPEDDNIVDEDDGGIDSGRAMSTATIAQGPQINLLKLGKSFGRKYRSIPPLDFMYGNEPKEPEAKPAQTERRTRQVKKGLIAEKPCELRSDQVEQTETDKQVAAMKKELQKRKQINFWEFVIDPNDFPRSVENVFHSAFLIKDSWAQLDLKCDPPMLKYRDADNQNNPSGSGQEEEDAGHVENSEYIMEFDRILWKNMINQYRIRESLLPRTRPPRNDHDHRMGPLFRSQPGGDEAHMEASF